MNHIGLEVRDRTELLHDIGRVLGQNAVLATHLDLHLKSIVRDDLEGIEICIGLAAAPLDRARGGGNGNHGERTRIDVVFAGAEHIALDAAEAIGDDMARAHTAVNAGVVRILGRRVLLAFNGRARRTLGIERRRILADVRNQHPHLALANDRKRRSENGEEVGIDVVGTRPQHRLLRAAETAVLEKRLCILKTVVQPDIRRRRNDILARHRTSIARLDHADLIVADGDGALQFDLKHVGKNVVGAWTKELDLRPLLPAAGEEHLRLLERIVTIDASAEQLPLAKSHTVGRGHNTNGTLRNHGLLDLLDLEEQRMDLEGAVGEEAQLLASNAAIVEKRSRILEIVVFLAGFVFGVDASRWHRLAVGRGDHAQFVGGDGDEIMLAHHAHIRPRHDV